MRGYKWTKTLDFRFEKRLVTKPYGCFKKRYGGVTVFTSTDTKHILQQKEVSGPDERWVDVPVVEEKR